VSGLIPQKVQTNSRFDPAKLGSVLELPTGTKRKNGPPTKGFSNHAVDKEHEERERNC
jgi:hypothetical protein